MFEDAPVERSGVRLYNLGLLTQLEHVLYRPVRRYGSNKFKGLIHKVSWSREGRCQRWVAGKKEARMFATHVDNGRPNF